MSDIARYQQATALTTSLNPLDDLAALLQGHSADFLERLLREKHRLGESLIGDAATRIESLARTAVGFLQQGLAGPPELSFLPLYYAILNLSKAYIVLAGKGAALSSNQRHGAARGGDDGSPGLMGAKVKLLDRGVLPLFYETLTGETVREGTLVAMSELYPLIPSVAFELRSFLGIPSSLREASVEIFHDDVSDEYFFRLFVGGFRGPGEVRIENLPAFRGLQKDSAYRLVSPAVRAGSQDEARRALTDRYIVRSMIYGRCWMPGGGPLPHILTPYTDSELLTPEELPLWLAFFHLADVVRYRPERLQQYRSSSDWGVLLALSRHGLMRFLTLFWSALHQTELVVRAA